jgi:uncharacterized protein YaiI (UPF0178 family)
MMVEAVAPTRITTDARLAARHADAALRRSSSAGSAEDRPASRDGRRFEFALVRRVASM